MTGAVIAIFDFLSVSDDRLFPKIKSAISLKPLLEAASISPSTIVSAISFAIFTYIQSTPFEVIQKGKLIILGAALPLVIHALFSSLSDTQDRELVDAL